MTGSPPRKRLVHVAMGVCFWCAAGLALWWVPLAWRGAASQLAAVAVMFFAWRLGLWGGVAHGLVAAVLVSLFDHPSASAYLFGGGLDNPLSTAMLLLVGVGVGASGDQIRQHLARRRESEERYVLAARGANDGLWDWDLRSDRVYYSQRWCEILGYGQGELAGRAEDWLDRVHPSDIAQLQQQLREHLDGGSERYESEHRIRRQDGSWTWVLTRGICTRDESGEAVRITGWLTDISERKHAEERLRHYAFHDALTGLPNRALFMDRVEHALARLRRHPQRKLGLFMLDLDRFKNVNDSMGHLAGDELLCQIARRLENCVRAGDTIARLGGDEFTILVEDVDDPSDALRLAELLQRTVSAPVRLDDQDVVTAASIGIVVAGAEGRSPLDLLHDADQAMYRAKRQGKGQQVLFDACLYDEASQRLSLETALRAALEAGDIHVHYQPIVDLAHGNIRGFEAFARWNHPDLGPISPREFVYVAEETGLIQKLGDMVLDEALESLRRWNDLSPDGEPFTMGVNVSLLELSRPDWAERACSLMRSHGLSPELLSIEVTEHALMENTDTGHQRFEDIRRAGVRIQMDDFGTGYSSLSYLHRVPLDALKIDGSFVRQLQENTGAEEIVRAVVSLARNLDLQVIAEGVEREAQLLRLRELGCNAAQGFFFCAPTSRDEISALLRSAPKW